MDQLKNHADDRLLVGCLYCGGGAETREHVPPRVFLDAPFPTNLPIVDACLDCNNGFSADEEYLACLLEVAFAGITDPAGMRRPTVARVLSRAPKLRQMIESLRGTFEGRPCFLPDHPRVLRVVIKLARGHAAFELSEPCRDEPTSVVCRPLALMTDEEREEFDEPFFAEIFPEIGSRAMQRMMVIQGPLAGTDGAPFLPPLIMQDWQDVQKDRYSYLATNDGEEVRIRILIGGYLACDVRWAR